MLDAEHLPAFGQSEEAVDVGVLARVLAGILGVLRIEFQPMKAVGRNTATSAKVVAITAMPISSAASSAASIGLLPMRKCRAIFSISTIASSTRMPTTSASETKVTVFKVKPK